ncbi:hypothetical protein niasHT_004408 [Heterodera trifolii]|uniref:Uncharacterized protein n=1 Tax=Heterodera trifolii TaxID=157864 RepID=A0ABD2LLW7_9BILA
MFVQQFSADFITLVTEIELLEIAESADEEDAEKHKEKLAKILNDLTQSNDIAISGIFQQKFLKIRELMCFVDEESIEIKLKQLNELAEKTKKIGKQLKIVKKLAAMQSKKTTEDSLRNEIPQLFANVNAPVNSMKIETTKKEIEEAFKVPASKISVPERKEWDEEDDD